jgi:hypothetical protein
MSLNPVAATVANRLRREGYTNAQIAGILGNFQQESGFNPRVNEGGFVGAPKGRGGYGLAQWTGGRQSALINFARQRKMDPGDPGLQADFLVHELTGPEKAAAASLRQAKSPEQAALVFRRDFERAGIPKDDVRMSAARSLLPKLELGLQAPQETPAAPQTELSVQETLSRVLGPYLVDEEALNKKTSLTDQLIDSFKQQVLPSLLAPALSAGFAPYPSFEQ